MKKLYVPLLLEEGNTIQTGPKGCRMFFRDALNGFNTKEEAIEEGQKMVLTSPKSKVVIMESSSTVEARRIEFVNKEFNSSGELVV